MEGRGLDLAKFRHNSALRSGGSSSSYSGRGVDLRSSAAPLHCLFGRYSFEKLKREFIGSNRGRLSELSSGSLIIMTLSADSYIFGSDKVDIASEGRVVYLILAIVTFGAIIYQLVSLRRLKLCATFVFLPLLSFCLAYKTLLMYLSCMMSEGDISDGSVGLGLVLQAAITPLMLIILFEMTYRLHEFRNVHFLWFDLEVNGENDAAELILWINRLTALACFCMELAVSFNWGSLDNSDPKYVGSGGYAYLNGHASSTTLWLTLLPRMILCIASLIIGSFLYKYGVYVALGNNMQWRAINFISAVLVITQSFSYDAFPITSCVGEVAMLLSLTWAAHLTQEDLAIAASFADFLHRSNDAFAEWASKRDKMAEINQSERTAGSRGGAVHRTSIFVARRILRTDSISSLDDVERGGVEAVARAVDNASSSRGGATREIEMVEPQASPKADGTVDLSSF